MPATDQTVLAPAHREPGRLLALRRHRWAARGLDILVIAGLVLVTQGLFEPSAQSPLWSWTAHLPAGARIADLAGIGIAALLVTAVHGFLRFTLDGDTHAGITTGLLIVVVALWDWRSLVLLTGLVLVGAELTRRKHPGEPGAALATICVLAFPTLAALLSWAYLAWRFGGGR